MTNGVNMKTIKQMIRSMVEEQISTLTEEAAKDRFILSNNNLSREEKDTLIDIFNEHPQLESGIDWNKAHLLGWSDFKEVMKEAATKEISKLKKNEDYVQIKGFECDDPSFVGAYIPLTWKGSQVLASKKVGFERGNWCIAHTNDKDPWITYTYGLGSDDGWWMGSPSIFIFVIYVGDKYSIQTREDNEIIIWDSSDIEHGDDNDIVPGVDVRSEVSKITGLLKQIREKLDTNPDRFPWVVKKVNDDGSIEVDDDVTIVNGKYPHIRSITGHLYIEGTEIEQSLPMDVGGSIRLIDCDIYDDHLAWKFDKVVADVELGNFGEITLDFNEVGRDVELNTSGMRFSDVTISGHIKGDLTIKYGDLSYDSYFDSYINDQIREAAEYDAREQWEEGGNDPDEFEFNENTICWDCYGWIWDDGYSNYFLQENPNCKVDGSVTINGH